MISGTGLATALLALCVTTPVFADTIRVAVASNFAPALRVLQAEFESSSGHTLALSAGSTGKHYAQIIQGAPFAVFLAADSKRPRLLEQQGIAIQGSRFTYARGRLVLVSLDSGPAETRGTPLDEQLREAPPPRLAIANPRLAPYGLAAEAFLRHEGLWETFQPRLIMGENVSQAFQFVTSGAVPLGLVSLAQIRSLGRHNDTVLKPLYQLIDEKSHPPIDQQAVLLMNTDATQAFMHWLRSAPVRVRLAEFGYDTPHVER